MHLKAYLHYTNYPHVVHVELNYETCTILPNVKICEGWNFIKWYQILEYMLISSHFKNIKVFSKVFWNLRSQLRESFFMVQPQQQQLEML